MRIRRATADDAGAIASIYAPYVTGSAVSFETEPPDSAAMGTRIGSAGDAYPWLVVCDADDAIRGYAYASAFRLRRAYRFTVETTAYLADGAQGQGIGRRLYGRLMETLEAQGFAQAIGAVTLPNEASVGLHEAVGFAKIGEYERVGFKLGRWHSVGLWQRPLAAPADPPAEPKTVSEVWSD